RAAVGTSLLVIAINAAAALLGHLNGGVDVGVTALFIVGGTVGSILGSRLSGRIDEGRLLLGFAGMVVLVALYIIGRTVLGHGATA
nr:TSUP family transporter [Chloroflexota bacterium]